MTYTSEQYKYLLLKRLQRHFSLKTEAERLYTYTFFCKLFDESVNITEEAYNRFIAVMDDELEYCSKNNIYLCEEIPVEDIDSHALLLTDAFEAIGIKLEIEKLYDGSGDLYGGNAIFTKPNGEKMIYNCESQLTASNNYFYINASNGMEYQYAQLAMPYYNFDNMRILSIDEVESQKCGPDSYWRYNADTKTMRIFGAGEIISVPKDEQLGSGEYETLIIGSNINPISKTMITSASTLVLLHAADAELVMSGSFDSKSTYELTAYTDNQTFISYNWANHSNITITIHPLSEWGG